MYYINKNLDFNISPTSAGPEEFPNYIVRGFFPISREIAQLAWLYINQAEKTKAYLKFNSRLGCKSFTRADGKTHILESGMLEEILENIFIYFNLNKDNSTLVEVREYDNLD